MSTYKNLISLGAAAVLALGLAACSSGSDTPLTPDPDPDPTPPPVASACPGTDAASHKACVDEKKMAMDEAKKALDAAKADQSSTQAQIAAAQKAYDDAMKAHTGALTAQSTYAAMQPPTYNLKAMDKAVKAPTAANAVADAIDGGKPAAANEDDYAKATWPVEKLSGFMEAVYEDSKTGTSIVTYTDKSAPMGAKYSEYYDHGTDSPVNAAPTTAIKAGYTNKPWVGVEEVSTAGVVSFADNVTKSPISLAHGASADSTRTLTKTDVTTTKADESKFSETGMFHGIPGTFKCAGTGDNACKATTNAKGELTGLTGGGSDGWTFTPDENTGSMMVDGVLLDADYLDFGYWVTTTAGTDGPTYAVGTFAKGMTAATTQPSSMSATYKGGAAGLYTKREYSGSAGKGDLTAAGRFTATADLTAYFGDFTIPDKDGAPMSVSNSVRGTISNFMDGGQSIDSTWSVALQGQIGSNAAVTVAENSTLRAATFYGG